MPTFLRNAPGLNEIAAEVDWASQFSTTDELRALIAASEHSSFDTRLEQHQLVRTIFSPTERAAIHASVYQQAFERMQNS